jgi:hypothetical protein
MAFSLEKGFPVQKLYRGMLVKSRLFFKKLHPPKNRPEALHDQQGDGQDEKDKDGSEFPGEVHLK